MKKVIVCVITLLLFGCAGDRFASLKVDENGITHVEKNRSALLPPISTLELANSYRIVKDAETRENFYNKLLNSQPIDQNSKGQTTGYIFGFVNNDPIKSAYFFHPEISGLKMPLTPNGGFQVVPFRDVPIEIVFYDQNGKIAKKYNPRNSPKFEENVSHKKSFNGVLVDYVVTINRL